MRNVDMVHAVPPGTHVLLDNVVFRPVRSQQFCTAGGGLCKVCIKRVLSLNFDTHRIHGRNGTVLGGGFKYFLCSPLLGQDSHFD